MSQLVLASTSPYRQKLLERLGLAFACCAPGIDEAAVKQGIAEPEALARELARQKAMAGLRENPGAFVIGSDQVATIDGIVLDKPGTAERAAAQLATLQGRDVRIVSYAPHVVATAMQEEIRAVDEARFPRRRKFVELKESNALVPPEGPAGEIAALLEADDLPRWSARRFEP